MESSTLRRQLMVAPSSTRAGASGLWAWLAGRVDLAQYHPQALPGIAVSRLASREGPYVILKNVEAKTYYRMTDRDYFLWEKMDGTRTVKDLVVAYFLEYKSFAFARVASLVHGLKQHRFLVDEPVNVYGQVRAELQRRRPRSRLVSLPGAIMGKQFAIDGLDRAVSALYRSGGRLLFSRPALVLYALIVVVGLVCFFRAFRPGDFGVVEIAGSYTWGLLTLAVAYLLAIFTHETAHALTVKHYGCEVRRGGFMLYMAMPGFFVDTTDIWMKGKRARLGVTWAGPYSGLILGGLASIVLIAWPGFVLNALLFKFAFMLYILVFFNLNPLLELDGYYLLMDALEIPGLRQKSLAFLRTGLAAKLKGLHQASAPFKAVLASFSREERIFAVFGILSAVWTAYALYGAARYYQVRLASAFVSLWTHSSAGQTAVAVLILLVSLPIVLGLAIIVWSMVRNLLRLAARRGLFAGWSLAALLVIAAALLALAPAYVGLADLLPVLGLAALIVWAAFAGSRAVELGGSRLASAFWLLAAFALTQALAEGVDMAAAVGRLGAGPAALLPAGLSLLAAICLLGSGLALLANTDVQHLRVWEKTILVVGLVLAAGLVWFLGAGRAGPPAFGDLVAWPGVLRPVASLVALILMVPTLASFWATGLAPAWVLLALALAGLVLAAVPGINYLVPVQFAYLLLAATGLAFHRLSGLRGDAAASRAQHAATLALLDADRLDQAFAWNVASLWRDWRAIGGDRQVSAQLEQFNSYALAAGWHLHLLDSKVVQALSPGLSLARRGDTYAAALTLLLDLMARHVGEKLTVRALQRAYDGLPWDQREVAAQYVLPHVPRAEALGRQFLDTRQSYRTLLRRIPLFATAGDAELDLICIVLHGERFAPGRTIIRQGERGDRFYIIEQGHVEVTHCDERGVTEIIDHLDRGDYFGELALLHDAPRNATCRATVPTRLLSLSRDNFALLVKQRFELRDGVEESIGRVELLRQVPLFADMDTRHIQLLAARMREESYAPGEVLIRQGDEGNTFYVVESGCIQTVVKQEDAERVVAERGPGEYVGEIALLMRVPRTASVRAVTAVQVLALDREEFDRLVTGHLFISRGLESEASRRMLHLRQVAGTP